MIEIKITKIIPSNINCTVVFILINSILLK